jgi:hypothetical protein
MSVHPSTAAPSWPSAWTDPKEYQAHADTVVRRGTGGYDGTSSRYTRPTRDKCLLCSHGTRLNAWAGVPLQADCSS